MKYNNKTILFIILILILFLYRTCYGLVSQFWFDDEFQIYLIGLKSFTTHTWPFYGPDVVYTNTQISGALQGILVSVGFYLFPYPESPTIVLNVLSFLSLSLFSYYISKRITTIPKWLTLVWIMTLTWTMDFSTRVVNPSYVIVFSIPFFISVFELLPIYETKIFSKKLSYFILGITPFLIMQLHLSFVLLFPFILLVFYFEFKRSFSVKEAIIYFSLFITGVLIGVLSVIPTWLLFDGTKSTSSNVVFNFNNYQNIVVILTRYLSFATYEIPYILGGDTTERMNIIKYSIWMSPFTIYLLLFGFLLILSFVFTFIKNKEEGEWKKIKQLTLFGFILLFMSFFFSIKGPSSHTFYLMLPLPVFYSFYCYEWLWKKYKFWKTLMYISVFSCFFFYIGIGRYKYKYESLYKDREKVLKAINMKDYKILGERRTSKWGYGY